MDKNAASDTWENITGACNDSKEWVIGAYNTQAEWGSNHPGVKHAITFIIVAPGAYIQLEPPLLLL